MQDTSQWIAPLHREMGKVVVGQRGLIDRLLLGVLTNGHILLEGVPGLAKTLALKTLAGCIHGARFGRIQFTPDMLPSDITGTTIYHGPSARFQVKHGPVFANLVLADEINRAPARRPPNGVLFAARVFLDPRRRADPHRALGRPS